MKAHSDVESPLVLTCLTGGVGQIIRISDSKTHEYQTHFVLFTFLCTNIIQLAVRICEHKFIYVCPKFCLFCEACYCSVFVFCQRIVNNLTSILCLFQTSACRKIIPLQNGTYRQKAMYKSFENRTKVVRVIPTEINPHSALNISLCQICFF